MFTVASHMRRANAEGVVHRTNNPRLPISRQFDTYERAQFGLNKPYYIVTQCEIYHLRDHLIIYA